nr:Gfo/Idh/MocA family oxidoreductase [uncultured Albidiferax sp.]
MVVQKLGRRLRLGVVGGGAGSFIGPVHRMAARLDGAYDIVASALSSNPERGRRGGLELGLAPERCYGTWQELIASERHRSDRVDVLAVMTPNDSHFAICMEALDAGFHIICDKPLATELAQAQQLAAKVRSTGLEFCVTYCYSGYPMVRQARDMVHSGQLGTIRQIHLQYVQGNLADAPTSEGWRMDPARLGGSLVLLDIGTHAFHLGAYVSGLDIERLCADVGPTRPAGVVDDYVATLMHYSQGARGSLWVTNAAAGSEHGLSIRIHGDKGGLEWHQEQPNQLLYRNGNGFDQVLTRRLGPLMSPSAQRSIRVERGHPEGYLEAFANLYSEFAQVVAARIANDKSEQPPRLYPDVHDGVMGLRYVEAALQSTCTGQWAHVANDSALPLMPTATARPDHVTLTDRVNADDWY